MTIRFAIFAILFVTSVSFAQPAQDTLIVSAIEVEGNVRSDQKAILRMMRTEVINHPRNAVREQVNGSISPAFTC